MANMIPSIKFLNISGFLNHFEGFGMLLVESFDISKLIKLIIFAKFILDFEHFLIYIENITDLSRLISRCTKLLN